ncbi:MAG TPA: MMPL family transporter [Acidimicrobiales bacterium]|nr:MMPL family transporter [Acidimicrobiales bacterium]
MAAYLVGGLVGQRNLTDAQMGDGQSGTATSVMEKAFPYHNGEEVLFQARSSSLSGRTALAAAVEDLVARLRRFPTVAEIQSPFPEVGAIASPALRSADGRSVLVTFDLAGNSNQAETYVDGPLSATAATAADHPQLLVEECGSASAAKALGSALNGDFAQAEQTSLPITLVILLVAFGALVAAGVPLLLGFTAVVAALGLLGPVSHLYPVAQGEIGPVVLLVGLAVGVDYSMFYLRRKLEERRAGQDGAGALARAAATSGRAVLISGLTVMAAMAGMLMAGNAVFVSFGIGTMLVVAAAMVGSVTVLPAVMAWLGDRVERGRVPLMSRRPRRGHSAIWDRLLARVLHRPWLSVVLAGGVLLALGAPAIGMRTVDPGMSSFPQNLAIMKVYDRIQAAFPGAPCPALVVVTSRDVTAPAVRDGVSELTRAVEARHGQMGGPVVETVSPDRNVAILTVSLAGDGTDSRSSAALAALRNKVVPATIGKVPGTKTYVAGTTAQSVDFNQAMARHLPYVFAFVLGMAFLLLLLSFRSVLVALLTIVLNLLSVGAAYGLMVLVFQDGFGRSLLGATDVGGIVFWIPLFLLVILFGLSMDYHVLVLSRVREGRDRGLPHDKAVAEGIAATAGVITSAALVMVAVFSVFATLSVVQFKQVGVALAAAVLIDATIVRVVLLPSAMKLLGRWTWYLPGWLGFIDQRLGTSGPLPGPCLGATFALDDEGYQPGPSANVEPVEVPALGGAR